MFTNINILPVQQVYVTAHIFRLCEIIKDGEELEGHAAQNRCFLRFLHPYIGDCVKNPVDNQVWQLWLKLRETVELICALKIIPDCVHLCLKIVIKKYIHLRSTMFPGSKLKTTHHYHTHHSTFWCFNSTVQPKVWKQALLFGIVSKESV